VCIPNPIVTTRKRKRASAPTMYRDLSSWSDQPPDAQECLNRNRQRGQRNAGPPELLQKSLGSAKGTRLRVLFDNPFQVHRVTYSLNDLRYE